MTGVSHLEWPVHRLGDLIVAKYGKALPQAKRRGGPVPVYGSNGVVGQHDAAITSGPAIIIGRKGSSGAVNYSNVACWPIDTTYYLDEPGPFSLDFLNLLLRSLRLEQLDRSTAIPGLNRDQLYDIEVPLPPVQVQETLVDLISGVSRLRDNAATHIAAARRAIERFRHAVLVAACSGKLTEEWRAEWQPERPEVPASGDKRPKHLRRIEDYDLGDLPNEWRWVQVQDLLPHRGIFDGPFGSNLKTSDYTDSGARVIRLENIGHLSFRQSKRTFVSAAKYSSLQKHAVYPGDIVFSSFVGDEIRVCVLPDDLDKKSLAKADCFTLRPTAVVDRQYLALQLATRRTHRLLISDVHGATRPRVNTSHVRGVPIPLCSLDEQREIVRRVNKLFDIAVRLHSQIEIASSRLDRSSQAVLGKAFRGELQGVG